MRYLLSTGEVTSSITNYILDLFKLNLKIYPRDIPNSNIGFDFTLIGIKETDLLAEIKSRMLGLINRIQNRFSGISISLDSIELLSKENAIITINVNGVSDNIEVNIG